MLQVKNLTMTHKKDLRILLKDFSFVLNDGDKAAIIGEEGNGKSTLMKLLYSPVMVEDYVEYEGEIIRNGAHIGYLAQELTPSQCEKSIYDFFQEEENFFLLNPKELSQIANGLGLSVELFYSEQQIGQLSGGEKVKVQIARLLIGKPDILFLDEPSNDIDLTTFAWLENFILNSPLPILYISHDETLLERTANKIIHLEQIRRKTLPRYAVMSVGYAEYVERRAAGLLHQEQVAKKERSDYKKQQERFQQIYQKVEHRQTTITRQDPFTAQLLKKKIHALKSQERRFEKQAENMTELPESEDSIFIKFGDNIQIPNGKTILDYHLDKLQLGERLLSKDIHLRVNGPQHVCIIGKNGVGKTTLLKRIAAELLPRTDIKAFYMPQNYEEKLDLNQTPVEFLSETSDKIETDRNRTYLGSMKYTAEEMFHPIRELSGGQKAKLLLLKISILGCNVLILDEPTRNFSPLSGPVIRKMLRNFSGTIISISHDRKYMREVCDRIYELTREGLTEVEMETE